MQIDSSLLKNIDFTNRDSLMFFAILLIVAIIVFFIFIKIVIGIIIFAKRTLVRIFGKKHAQQSQESKKTGDVFNQNKPRIVGGNTVGLKVPDKSKIDDTDNKNTTVAMRDAKMPLSNKLNLHNKKLLYGREEEVAGAETLDQASFKESAEKGALLRGDNSSMFEEGSEVSRRNLNYKIKLDPKFKEARRKVGLQLSSEERNNLVKETFSSAFGANISKKDLKQGLKKLSKKMRSAPTSKEHARLRKEIKFFKKVGGI